MTRRWAQGISPWQPSNPHSIHCIQCLSKNLALYGKYFMTPSPISSKGIGIRGDIPMPIPDSDWWHKLFAWPITNLLPSFVHIQWNVFSGDDVWLFNTIVSNESRATVALPQQHARPLRWLGVVHALPIDQRGIMALRRLPEDLQPIANQNWSIALFAQVLGFPNTRGSKFKSYS